jgi:hypothetical protein
LRSAFDASVLRASIRTCQRHAPVGVRGANCDPDDAFPCPGRAG